MDIGGDERAAPPADTVAPETTLVKGPRIRTKSRKAKFAFSSSEAESTFRCKLDRGSFAACESPLKYRRLKRGRHTFAVVATDAAGNADSTPAVYKWKVKRRRKR